jgi:hypothetical protein
VVQLNLTVAGLDLTQARVVWEAADREPYTGRTLTLTPAKPGPLWVEAEAAWPDGRRAFAATNLTVSAR